MERKNLLVVAAVGLFVGTAIASPLLGGAPVFADEETYSYEPDSPDFTQATYHNADWTYIGPATFGVRTDGDEAPRHVPLNALDQDDHPGPTYRVDSDGRRWVLTSTADLQPSTGPAQPYYDEGQTNLDEYTAWQMADCSNPTDGTIDDAIHDAENRATITNYAYRAQQAQVMIYAFNRQGHPSQGGYTYPIAGVCSGTGIDRDVVLTAAHCISFRASNGDWLWDWDPNLLVVCNRGNVHQWAGCRVADSISVNPAWYTTNGSSAEDWGVVFTDGQIVGGGETAEIAGGGKNDWDDHLTRLAAYHGQLPSPGGTPTCTQNVDFNPTDPAITNTLGEVLPITFGSDLLREGKSGADTNYSSLRIKTRLDVATGASGGTYYFCNNEDCDDVPQIIGIQSVRNTGPVSHRHRGPRADRFRTWVDNVVP